MEKKEAQKIFDALLPKVCEYYKLSKAAVLSRSKKMELVTARWALMYGLHKNNVSKYRIAKLFQYDISTIINGIRLFTHNLKINRKDKGLQGFAEKLSTY